MLPNDTTTLALIACLFGYVFGSVPFGLLLTRAAGLGDIRAIGSGNIGATNVLRTGNKGLAAATLILDALKGTFAVVCAWYLLKAFVGQEALVPPIADAGVKIVLELPDSDLLPFAVAAGYGAFLGHLYPIWLGFRGGKGVATYIGVLIGLFWPAALAFCGIWLAMAVAFRYSSLSALIAAGLVPIATALLGSVQLALLLVPLSLVLIAKHHANIQRLLAGQEPKIGAKA